MKYFSLLLLGGLIHSVEVSVINPLAILSKKSSEIRILATDENGKQTADSIYMIFNEKKVTNVVVTYSFQDKLDRDNAIISCTKALDKTDDKYLFRGKGYSVWIDGSGDDGVNGILSLEIHYNLYTKSDESGLPIGFIFLKEDGVD